ncbi:NAD-dependent epimerase/dehydratase family protein [uncultured Croceitalea sp.]|uniref:NAD-dependent epimerase/dehydratase family protein n=1 Tax=uncultured Croceitalea sp. TaxID=1798908 RepID=UPI0033062F31
MSKSIGVLGCGWLGTPLAKALMAEGYQVKGTTTTTTKLQALRDDGIDAYKVAISAEAITGNINSFLKSLDTLIINIPPNLRKPNGESFVKRISLLTEAIVKSKVGHVLFVSSTSVYGNVSGDITESTELRPRTESGKQLLAVEQQLMQHKTFNCTIVRFGGLIGPDRHPVTYLSGKKDLKNGHESVNLIHLNDCILLLKTILKNNYWNSIFNGVYQYYPTKKAYYTLEAIKRGIAVPHYQEVETPNSQKAIKSDNFYVKSHQLLTTIVS